MEKDAIVIEKVQKIQIFFSNIKETDKVAAHLADIYNEGAEEVIANARYAFMIGLMNEAVSKPALENQQYLTR